jgi:hypothetical protein
MDQMVNAEKNSRLGTRVKVLSGHDVNILGLLYALDADPEFLRPPFWPDFGSNLVFELSLDELVINLYYNMQPLQVQVSSRSLDITSNSNTSEQQCEQKKKLLRTSISVTDLKEIYNNLERKSG